MAYQSIVIVGNVGKDAEIAYTPQGVAVCKFTVAVNKVTGRGETRKEKTTWFQVTLWREAAENLHQYIKKGNQIMVVGEVSVNAYLDRSGQAAASLQLDADKVVLLGGKGEGKPAAKPVEEPDEIPF